MAHHGYIVPVEGQTNYWIPDSLKLNNAVILCARQQLFTNLSFFIKNRTVNPDPGQKSNFTLFLSLLYYVTILIPVFIIYRVFYPRCTPFLILLLRPSIQTNQYNSYTCLCLMWYLIM